MSNAVSPCPAIVKKVVTEYTDLLANTTATAHGTVVRLFCAEGHILIGEPIVRCRDSSWDKPIGSCISKADYNNMTSGPTAAGLFDSPLSKENLIIILSVCCAVAFLILVALIFVLCLYRGKRRQLKKHKKLTHSDSMRSQHQLEKPWPMPVYPVSTMHTDNAYPSHAARWNHMGHVLPQQGRPIRLSQYPLYLNSYQRLRDNQRMSWAHPETVHPHIEYEKKLKRMSFNYPESKDSTETELSEIKWDPNKMSWHDSFDYSHAKIPRPQVTLANWKKDQEEEAAF